MKAHGLIVLAVILMWLGLYVSGVTCILLQVISKYCPVIKEVCPHESTLQHVVYAPVVRR